MSNVVFSRWIKNESRETDILDLMDYNAGIRKMLTDDIKIA